MAEMIFYTHPQSRGRIVRRMLEECGASYRTEVVQYAGMKSPEYLRLNPMGKVPALVYDGRVVTESAAILTFLAEVHPAADLAPAPAERQDYYRWLFYCAGPVEAAITNKALGVAVSAEQSGFVGYGNYELVVKTLHEAVADREFIAGAKFSAADVLMGSMIDFGLRFGTLSESAPLRAYVDRLLQRPAWVRAAALDDALLAAQ